MKKNQSEAHFYCPNQLILKQGTNFNKKIKIANLPVGQPNLCYMNAYRLAIENGYIYCEGYAISENVIGLPIEHAWCVTKDKEIVDNTWGDMGKAYFGIPFTMEYITFIAKLTGNYGIFGWLPDSIVKKGLPDHAIFNFEN